MSKTALLIFAALAAIIYGIALVVMPAAVNEMHGVSSSPGTSLMSAYFGSALIGIGLMAWQVRNADQSDVLTAMFRGVFAFAAIGLVISLYAMATGLINAVGWVPVVIQAVLTLGFGYFSFVKR